MRKLLLLMGLGFSLANAQTTTLFTENFNSGAGGFTLNTSDLSASYGSNLWLVNNSYTGGSGTFICLGYPFGFSVGTTPSQPSGIVGNPNSGYLHITSTSAQSQGILNSNFLAADGICNFSESYFASMTNDINTTAYDTVKLSFWWMCSGSNANYGEVYYSTNSGSSWVQISSPLSFWYGQSNWTQVTLTNPNFDGQSTLRFGFRFVNNVTSTAADPPFSIDDISIVGITVNSNTITTGLPSDIELCAGDNFTLPFLAAGVFNGGNVFTAQLSDASGNFTSPTAIGTLNGTSSGTINCTLPTGLSSGTGYQVRVVGSDPTTTGTVSALNLTIHALPNATANNNGPICDGEPLALISGGGETYSWVGPGTFTSLQQNPTIAVSDSLDAGDYIVTVTDTNGCVDTAITTVVINPCLGIEDESDNLISIYPNPTQNEVMITFNDLWAGEKEIKLYNLIGEKLIHEKTTQSFYTINLKSFQLSTGTYLLELEHQSERVLKKVILQ